MRRWCRAARPALILTIPCSRSLIPGGQPGAGRSYHYADHQDDFRTIETVELDYIELTPEQFVKPVEDSAVLEAYQLEIENAQYKTENRVSHILFETRKDEDEDALQQRVTPARRPPAGADFGAVARSFPTMSALLPMAVIWAFPAGTPSQRKWKKRLPSCR